MIRKQWQSPKFSAKYFFIPIILNPYAPGSCLLSDLGIVRRNIGHQKLLSPFLNLPQLTIFQKSVSTTDSKVSVSTPTGKYCISRSFLSSPSKIKNLFDIAGSYAIVAKVGEVRLCVDEGVSVPTEVTEVQLQLL